jgi:hypothetical protein
MRATVPFNLAGLPALSVPFTFSSEQLPINVQLVSRWLDEATILRLGSLIEAGTKRNTVTLISNFSRSARALASGDIPVCNHVEAGPKDRRATDVWADRTQFLRLACRRIVRLAICGTNRFAVRRTA